MSIAADQARWSILQQGFAGARAEIAALCEKMPDDPDLNAFYALTLVRTGEFEQAEMVMARFGDESAGIAVVDAQLRMILGDRVRASELLRNAWLLDPDHYLLLAIGPTLAKSIAEVDPAALSERARTLFPEDPGLYAVEGLHLLKLGKLDECRAFLEESPHWFQSTHQYLNLRGRLAQKRQNAVEAEAQYESALRLCPGGSTWSLLALSQFVQGKIKEAGNSAGVALSLNPRDAAAFRVLAQVAHANGDSAAEEDFLRKAGQAAPESWQPKWFRDAVEFVRTNQWDPALQVFRAHGQQADPRYGPLVRKAILRILCHRERWQEVREQLDEIERMDEYTAAMDCWRCQLRFHEGQKVEALAEMRMLLDSRGQPAEVYLAAVEMFVAGSPEDFKMLIERLKSDAPNSAQVLGLIVVKLHRSKKGTSARAVLAAARRKFPESHSLRRLDIHTALADGDASRARRLLRELPPGRRGGFPLSKFVKAYFVGFLRKSQPASR